MNINVLAEQIHDWAIRKGFWEDGEQRNVPEMLMFGVTELSEAMEAWRDSTSLADLRKIHWKAKHDDAGTIVELKPEGFAIELADAIIRILDTAEGLGVDLEEAITLKMKFNETRPRKHGRIRA